jgi:hypothetical protein
MNLTLRSDSKARWTGALFAMMLTDKSEGLETTRQDLWKNAVQLLDATEKEAKQDLDQLLSQLERTVKINIKAEKNAGGSVESTNVTTFTEFEDGKPSEEVKINLNEHMQMFNTLVEDEERNLEALWSQWVEVQVDIASLAAEVFGQEPAEEDPDKKGQGEPPDILKAKMEEARENHKTYQGQHKAAIEELQEIEADASETAHQTLKIVKDERKVRQPRRRSFNTDLSRNGLHANGTRWPESSSLCRNSNMTEVRRRLVYSSNRALAGYYRSLWHQNR